MRLAHLGTNIKIGCQEDDKLYSDGIKEIADWVNTDGNQFELLRIYINVSLLPIFLSLKSKTVISSGNGIKATHHTSLYNPIFVLQPILSHIMVLVLSV